MRHDRRFFLLAELVLGAAAVAMLIVMFSGKKENPRAAVIVSESDSGRWVSFISGIKQAAAEQEIDLVISSTGELTAEQERTLIRQELAGGADALMVQPAPGSDTDSMLRSAAGSIPVMLVVGGSSPDADGSSFPLTAPDNYAMGQSLASMILEDFAGKPDGKTIGIVGQTLDTEAARMREQGFRDGLEGSGCQILWTLEGTGDDKEANISGQARADIVAVLDTADLEAAGADAEARKIHGALVYGIGSSTKALYFLDHDNISGLVVPNGFDMGYLGFTEIAEKLHHRSYSMKSRTISFRSVRREDLFIDEDQLLFFTE